MNSEVVIRVDHYNPDYISNEVKRKTYFVVNLIITVLCGLSTVMSFVSILAKEAWISEDFQTSVQIQDHFRNVKLLVILGTVCSLIGFVISVLRIRSQAVKQSRQCKTAQFFNLVISFVSLLSSVTIWADFIRHTPVEKLHLYQIPNPVSKTVSQIQSNDTNHGLNWPIQSQSDKLAVRRNPSMIAWLRGLYTVIHVVVSPWVGPTGSA
ncbi:hypothetical protein FGIG_03849 [Fasciola gigantica]|uniref:Uncharacterized protein n=1 Tax=Fasciola gigantica TaxID=46835 RepID=A0A504YY83_FASGI|nr:hypothetical protein FGIG_03849 [Fasciola gigantica]